MKANYLRFCLPLIFVASVDLRAQANAPVPNQWYVFGKDGGSATIGTLTGTVFNPERKLGRLRHLKQWDSLAASEDLDPGNKMERSWTVLQDLSPGRTPPLYAFQSRYVPIDNLETSSPIRAGGYVALEKFACTPGQTITLVFAQSVKQPGQGKDNALVGLLLDSWITVPGPGKKSQPFGHPVNLCKTALVIPGTIPGPGQPLAANWQVVVNNDDEPGGLKEFPLVPASGASKRLYVYQVKVSANRPDEHTVTTSVFVTDETVDGAYLDQGNWKPAHEEVKASCNGNARSAYLPFFAFERGDYGLVAIRLSP